LFVVKQMDVTADSDAPVAQLANFEHVYDALNLQTLQSGRMEA
jgi:hypothetical protein